MTEKSEQELTPEQKALQEAIAYVKTQAGGNTTLARLCKVSRMAIIHWLRDGVTAERAKEIEVVTGGHVLRARLRPDIFL